MPEPEGRADPPEALVVPVGSPVVSGRRLFLLYRSGAGLLVLGAAEEAGGLRSMADKGRWLVLRLGDEIDESSLEAFCCGVNELERFKADTDGNRFGAFVERFGDVSGFVNGVTGAEAVRVSYRGMVGC